MVGQVTQKGDLCQGFNGDFRSVSADGNALVFRNATVQLAGQMQAVEAGLIFHFDAGAAPCGKGSGGVHGDQVVALTAVQGDAAGGKLLVLQILGNEVHRGLQKVLGKAEVPAAADAEPVLAIAAVHPDIGRAHVHSETEGVFAGRIVLVGKGQDHIAGVNELDAAHVLAVAQHHVHTHGADLTLGGTDLA